MRVVVTVPSGFLNDINNLVKEGKYSGLEEFLEVAIFNQLNLEKEPEIVKPNFDVKMQLELPNLKPIEKEKSQKSENITVLRPSQLVELSFDYSDVVLTEPPKDDKL